MRPGAIRLSATGPASLGRELARRGASRAGFRLTSGDWLRPAPAFPRRASDTRTLEPTASAHGELLWPTARGRPDANRTRRAYPDAVETWLAIDSIRVVRRFQARVPDEAHLRRILNAGRRAGSSKNLQRWAFIVVRDQAHLHDLAAVGPFAGHLAGAPLAIALVTPDPARADAPLSIMWDLGRAAQNMILAAWDLGIGSVPATVYDQELARRLLGYPDDQWCEFLISFGYPADQAALTAPKRPGGRVTLGSIVHEERW